MPAYLKQKLFTPLNHQVPQTTGKSSTMTRNQPSFFQQSAYWNFPILGPSVGTGDCVFRVLSGIRSLPRQNETYTGRPIIIMVRSSTCLYHIVCLVLSVIPKHYWETRTTRCHVCSVPRTPRSVCTLIRTLLDEYRFFVCYTP